jgi:aminopeptidase
MSLDKLADILVRYSTAVRPGDRVCLHAPPPAEPLLVALYREVLRAGGHPVVVMQPEACPELLCRHGSPEQLRFINPLEACAVEMADVAVHVLAGTGTTIGPPDATRQTLHGQAHRPLLELFLRRAAAGALRWVATQFPCPAAARAAGMMLDDYERFVFTAGLLDHLDPAAAWRAVAERQARVVDFLQGVRELRIVTPRGTDLRVGVAGRVWLNGAGHENFPDGEVFTGPIEDATAGTVCFDFPGTHSGRTVEGVCLVFRAGQVVDATALRGEEYLHRLLDQDAGARVLGEVALGCNYAVTRHTGNTLFDEKIGGTFHLALGASYPQSAGSNRSALHWDLVGDLRLGGRVEADGRTISTDGRFLDPDWPQP